jgi:hypothetical protein
MGANLKIELLSPQKSMWIPGLSKALPSSVMENWDRQSESMKATKKDRSARLAKLSAAGDPQPSSIQRKIQNADE